MSFMYSFWQVTAGDTDAARSAPDAAYFSLDEVFFDLQISSK